MKRIRISIKIGALLILMASCTNLVDDMPANPETADADGFSIPADFKFTTSKTIEVNLSAPDYLQGAVFQMVTMKNGKEGSPFGKGTFNRNGVFSGTYTLSTYIDTIRIRSLYVGLTDSVDVPISGNKASFDFRRFDIQTKSAYIIEPGMLKSASAVPFTYLSPYDNNGVPVNLAPPDILQSNLFDDLNNSLPEYRSVPQFNPEYLAGKETNLVLRKEADVWVTFVTEGASYRNSLGFYTDHTKELKIIFPNASLPGSSGNLKAGSKVYLGRFPANTNIGWFIVVNGWTGSQVNSAATIFYSDPELNPEQNPTLKTHMVLLNDKSRNIMFLGFEDQRRDGRTDNDFNDAVFYVTTNPVDAPSTSNVSNIKAANDSDNDGINDELDDFPFDPNKAFNNFEPSDASNGSLAFEDLWPSKGDYDFNDLVVDYTFNKIANAANQMTSLEATFRVAHIGGSLKNGFAFSLPIAPSLISKVEGQVRNGSYVTYSPNGTEAGQNKAVIFVVANAHEQKGKTISVTVSFASPISSSTLGSAPYDPFIVVNGKRNHEIHLADMPPTLLGGAYLGKYDDNSDPSMKRYYKSKRNLPWAINVYEPFDPPAEKVMISKKYPRFVTWANSGGTLEKNWYK